MTHPRPERARRPLTEILHGLGYSVDRIFSHTAVLGSVRTAGEVPEKKAICFFFWEAVGCTISILHVLQYII